MDFLFPVSRVVENTHHGNSLPSHQVIQLRNKKTTLFYPQAKMTSPPHICNILRVQCLLFVPHISSSVAFEVAVQQLLSFFASTRRTPYFSYSTSHRCCNSFPSFCHPHGTISLVNGFLLNYLCLFWSDFHLCSIKSQHQLFQKFWSDIIVYLCRRSISTMPTISLTCSCTIINQVVLISSLYCLHFRLSFPSIVRF